VECREEITINGCWVSWIRSGGGSYMRPTIGPPLTSLGVACGTATTVHGGGSLKNSVMRLRSIARGRQPQGYIHEASGRNSAYDLMVVNKQWAVLHGLAPRLWKLVAVPFASSDFAELIKTTPVKHAAAVRCAFAECPNHSCTKGAAKQGGDF
jgi:hypothetical protein